MFDWEDNDRFSFDDSDRFEEDSLCSWISEPESLCNNWRGWKRQSSSNNGNSASGNQNFTSYFKHYLEHLKESGGIPSLVEIAARQVGFHIPFEVVERVYPPVPEQLQLRIAVWSFPENEEDIRLYSCLANGSGDEFNRGELLYRSKAVKDPLQIGFHLSATVTSVPVSKGSYNVAITFDRKRITSCSCTCSSTASWCAHVVSMCLHRIHLPTQVCLRAPVSESLSRLSKVQLRKFAQYLIYEQPQQILPTAQKLLDDLLSHQNSPINTAPGAPDPTAGASVSEQTTWCLDEANLHENIHKILIKFCVPSPIVFSDVNYLSTTAPPAAAEWTSLLRPLRGREPEGMWNLLSIVREMFRRHDRNAIPLLEILTDECIACDQILVWWFNTKVSLLNSLGNSHSGRSNNINSNTHASQHACSSLCEEVVILWRLAALNPSLSPIDRSSLYKQFKAWHLKIIEKVCKNRGGVSTGVSTVAGGGSVSVNTSNNSVTKSEIEIFPGFKPALEACLLDWKSYAIPGVTYEEGTCSKWCFDPLTHARTFIEPCRDISSSPAVLSCDHHTCPYPSLLCKRGRSVEIGQSPSSPNASFHFISDPTDEHMLAERSATVRFNSNNDGNRSSVSSEGFCDNFDMSTGLSDDASRSNVVITVNDSPDQNKNFDEESSHGAAASSNPTSATTDSHVDENTADNCFRKEKKSAVDELDSDSSSGAADTQNKIKPTGASTKKASSNGKINDGASEEYSPPSSDDQYQVYYYDTQTKLSPAGQGAQSKDNSYIFANVKKLEDPMEILFARAEALHAHGHTQEACKLAVKLAEEMLENPPNLISDIPAQTNKGKRNKKSTVVNTASHQMSCLASATLAKTAFLCTVLSENCEHYYLAFKVGMFGLEMPRPPASTKALEVKLTNQESDLVTLLKKIPLGVEEVKVIKERAMQLKEGTLRSRGEALLPLVLASFIFDSLCLNPVNVKNTSIPKNLNNEHLGFQSAVAALGLKANVSEAEHPLLCEGTRRQRGELAITLLVHYKDDQEKLVQIMDKLLDKEVHCMFNKPPVMNSGGFPTSSVPTSCSTVAASSNSKPPIEDEPQVAASNDTADPGVANSVKYIGALSLENKNDQRDPNKIPPGVNGSQNSQPQGPSASTGATFKHLISEKEDRDLSSSPTWEEDYKSWEAKFRCTNFKTHKKHSEGMASIDSSAPETTSSDNSPTMIRRWTKPVGPGSDSGSSGKSSDSIGSSSSGTGVVVEKFPCSRVKVRENESPLNFSTNPARLICQFDAASRTYMPSKNARFKSKKTYPSIPNQPSEASAHFMFELAKTVLTKAGGNSSTSLFTQPSTSQNHRGPHRALHMSAFQIGLYALGLHNCVSPNWLSRTYSSQVSWITGQAMEIGSAAITYLINTWEGHLTPPEVATLADKASRGRDPNMVKAAAELALSCLPHAHALNPNEVQRALIQCKEQSDSMLERACLAVELAAKGGGVYPEVLFDVARRWFDLFEQLEKQESGNVTTSHNDGLDLQHGTNFASVDTSTLFPNFNFNDALVSQMSAPQHHVLPPLPPPNGPYPPPLAPIPPSPMTYTNVTTAPLTYNYIHQAIPAGPAIFNHTLQPSFPTAFMPQPGPNPSQPPPYPYATNLHLMPTYYTLPTTTCAPPRSMASIPNPIYAVNGQMRPLTHPPPQIPSLMTVTHQHIPRPNGPHVTQPPPICNQTQLNYLLAAYRVGMLAMETLARKVHDDRPQAKYARAPPYGEDVKWLFRVAKRIGTSYLQQFCITTVNSVASPFVLQEIAWEAAVYLSGGNNQNGAASLNLISQHLRSPVLTPLVQKCQQMYIQCTHLRMFHITTTDFDDFISILRSAKTAFQMTPGGLVQFNELLQSLKRSKSCKKELWARIAAAV
ncbi:Zinc finger SWIM domain-containing protein 8 [Nymphon striatum]|nr:Zinc finger SWIM domain-containing protein 8 [Nymphon striatum]